MKYRIVKIITGDKIHYEVQKLIMWFFWITEEYFSCCIDCSADNFPIEFDSIEDAKLYINSQNVKMEVVCIK